MTERQSVHAINGRIGGLESWAGLTKDQRRQRTEAGRAAVLEQFAAQADPDGKLSDEERMRAAEQLRRAHMIRMARRSAQARAAKAGKSEKKKPATRR